MWYIFDLDNCLSDDAHRRHLALEGKYKEYHALADMDLPINGPILKGLVEADPDVNIAFVTGREEFMRQKTKKWLQDHFPKAVERHFILLMRPDGDHTPAPKLKVRLLQESGLDPAWVAGAYDDRVDVLEAYRAWGIKTTERLCGDPGCERQRDAAAVLSHMAETFRERNANYADNYKQVGKIMAVLHGPQAPVPATGLVGSEEQFNVWHLYELLVVKLTRFANSGLAHRDSIHDIAVYAAMIESILGE